MKLAAFQRAAPWPTPLLDDITLHRPAPQRSCWCCRQDLLSNVQVQGFAHLKSQKQQQDLLLLLAPYVCL